MVFIELSVLVFAPVLVFVIVAQRILPDKKHKRRRARYKGRFAEER